MGNPFAKPAPPPSQEASPVTVNPLTDEPCRPVGTWNKELSETLVAFIKDFKTGHRVENVRLLLLGPVGAGKSSFINSVASIDAGCISSLVHAGADTTSVTKKLVTYRPDKRIQGFRLIDTMGVEEATGKGFHVKDAANIIKGNLLPDYRFNPEIAADESSTYFVKEPNIKDKAHCVLYVMDARVLHNESVTKESQDKIKALQDDIKDIGVQQILILTHIDLLCPEVKKNLGNTYRSKRVQNAMKQGSILFGLPEMNIFPVENYHNDVEIDFNKDIHLLYALRQAMVFSQNYLKMEAQKEGQNESSDEDIK